MLFDPLKFFLRQVGGGCRRVDGLDLNLEVKIKNCMNSNSFELIIVCDNSLMQKIYGLLFLVELAFLWIFSCRSGIVMTIEAQRGVPTRA